MVEQNMESDRRNQTKIRATQIDDISGDGFNVGNKMLACTDEDPVYINDVTTKHLQCNPVLNTCIYLLIYRFYYLLTFFFFSWRLPIASFEWD